MAAFPQQHLGILQQFVLALLFCPHLVKLLLFLLIFNDSGLKKAFFLKSYYVIVPLLLREKKNL